MWTERGKFALNSDSGQVRFDVTHPDAILIATAPELLATLEALVDGRCDLDSAKAAIAKARGVGQ
ncbi:MAG: hypothetical protein HQL75_00520 [Magnetococcales bacterium]|nr:hypothetical protein [Magnetococcales bacterium]